MNIYKESERWKKEVKLQDDHFRNKEIFFENL